MLQPAWCIVRVKETSFITIYRRANFLATIPLKKLISILLTCKNGIVRINVKKKLKL